MKSLSPRHAPEQNKPGGASGCYRVSEGNQTCFSALSKVVYGFRIPWRGQIGVGCQHGCFLSPQKPHSRLGHTGMREHWVMPCSSARLASANMARALIFRQNNIGCFHALLCFLSAEHSLGLGGDVGILTEVEKKASPGLYLSLVRADVAF